MSTRNAISISIVTPSLNQGRFLEHAIQSVLNQNYPNLEYVLIDGGSTDGSTEILRKYKDKLGYSISQPDSGHGYALNEGFTHTSGEIMAWLNADDMYTSWAFAVVADIFEQFPQIKWLVGFNSWWSDNGQILRAERVPINIYDYLLGNFNWIQQESVFWRRDLWERSGGYIDTSLNFMVDGELWSRFFLHEKLYIVDCILGGYRIHKNNRSQLNKPQCWREMNGIVNRLQNKIDNNTARTLRVLRILQIALHGLGLRYLSVEKVFKRLFRDTYESAAYDLVEYQHGRWDLQKFPYTIKARPTRAVSQLRGQHWQW